MLVFLLKIYSNFTAISTGYSYNANEKTGQFFADLSFEAWYPKINLNYTNGQRQTDIYIDKSSPRDSLRSDKWNQQQMVLGVSLPFNFTRSKYYQSGNWRKYGYYTSNEL